MNDLYIAEILVDNECTVYCTITEKFIRIHSLLCFKITPQKLWDIDRLTDRYIIEITYFLISIKGIYQSRIYTYIMKNTAEHDIILGKS